MNKKDIKRIVKYCGGNTSKIQEITKIIENEQKEFSVSNFFEWMESDNKDGNISWRDLSDKSTIRIFLEKIYDMEYVSDSIWLSDIFYNYPEVILGNLYSEDITEGDQLEFYEALYEKNPQLMKEMWKTGINIIYPK